jgi:hypothetical protein
MTKFEDRLRTSLHAAAELLPDTAERIVTPAPPSPRRVRGPLVGVTVMVGALAIPLLGSLLWFSALGGPRTGDGADSHGLVESSPTADGATAPTGPNEIEFVIGRPHLLYAEVHAPYRDGWVQHDNFVYRRLDSGGRIGFSVWHTDGVYADPCHWETSGTEWGAIEDSQPIPGDGHAAAFIVPLMNQPNRQPSTPVEARVSGWGGARVELSVPADLDLELCDQGRYTAWTDISDTTEGNSNHEPGQADIVIFVDIDRGGVIIDGWFTADASVSDRVELEEMLVSIEVGFPEDFG